MNIAQPAGGEIPAGGQYPTRDAPKVPPQPGGMDGELGGRRPAQFGGEN